MNRFLILVVLFSCFARIDSAACARIESPRWTKWESLSADERELVQRRFELWKRMPEAQREKLRQRHDALVEVKAEVDRAAQLRPPQPRDDRKLRDVLKQKRKQILDGGRFAADEIEGLRADELVDAARVRALDRVDRLERDGVIDAEQASHLRGLPAPKLGRELRKVEKKRFLSKPPRRFLELPQAERDRLAALPPDEFLREIKRVVPPPRPPTGPLREPALPNEGSGSESLPGGQKDGRRRVPPDPRFLATKQWVDTHLDEAQITAIKQAEPFERRGVIRKILRARAVEALRARGDDPKWVEEIDLLPGGDRELRLIQLIDPTFDFERAVPPPPPRGPERDKPRRDGR